MPFERLWRKELEEEAAAEEQYVVELQQKLIDLRRELEVFESPAWQKVDELLAQKLADHFRAMMVGEPEQMLLARERARVVSELREEPKQLRARIAELQNELKQLEGEQDG